MGVYPYKLAPIYKEKIWGGRNLERLFSKALPAGVDVGESWELADLPEGECAIANGRRAGQSLHQVVAEEAETLMGATPLLMDDRFPLLLKLLDAEDTLSVQVHPDAEAVKVIHGAALKTECWYVLDSRHGYIYKGFKPGVTDEHLRAALADDDAVAELLMRYEVCAGDFHYLPAGTVHALGSGVVVAEVQTPSDTTYRLSDWGRGRPIHIRQALQCIHYSSPADNPPSTEGDCLLKTQFFHVFVRSAAPGSRSITRRCVRAWMVLNGQGEVRSDDPDGTVGFAAGDTLLLPAGLTAPTVHIFQTAKWLEIALPPF